MFQIFAGWPALYEMFSLRSGEGRLSASFEAGPAPGALHYLPGLPVSLPHLCRQPVYETLFRSLLVWVFLLEFRVTDTPSCFICWWFFPLPRIPFFTLAAR